MAQLTTQRFTAAKHRTTQNKNPTTNAIHNRKKNSKQDPSGWKYTVPVSINCSMPPMRSSNSHMAGPRSRDKGHRECWFICNTSPFTSYIQERALYNNNRSTSYINKDYITQNKGNVLPIMSLVCTSALQEPVQVGGPFSQEYRPSQLML